MDISEYSDKSIVVRGETKKYSDQLKALGGKWNRNLDGGAGWIFSKKKETEVRGVIQRIDRVSLLEERASKKKESTSSNEDSPFPPTCQKYPTKLPKTISSDITKFCSLLQANKVKDSKESFLKLPLAVQCLFLHHAWEILSHKEKYSEDSYMAAFLMFKLFRGADMKGNEIYSKYAKLKNTDVYYKKAVEFKRKMGSSSASRSRSSSSTTERSKSKSPSVRKKSPPKDPKDPKDSKGSKYDKPFQKFEAPKSELDPLYIFYTSLYSQKPKSALAVTWLTEHGVFDGDTRKKITKQYEKLKAEGKLIK